MKDTFDRLLDVYDKAGGGRKQIRLALMKQFNCYQCPTCGDVLDPDKLLWAYKGKLYCDKHKPEGMK